MSFNGVSVFGQFSGGCHLGSITSFSIARNFVMFLDLVARFARAMCISKLLQKDTSFDCVWNFLDYVVSARVFSVGWLFSVIIFKYQKAMVYLFGYTLVDLSV